MGGTTHSGLVPTHQSSIKKYITGQFVGGIFLIVVPPFQMTCIYQVDTQLSLLY